MPPSHKKIYIPLSLVHLIYTAGDKCMRQNACFIVEKLVERMNKVLGEVDVDLEGRFSEVRTKETNLGEY